MEEIKEVYTLTVRDNENDRELSRDFVVTDGVAPEAMQLAVQELVDSLRSDNE